MHYRQNNPYSLLLLFAKPFQSEMHIKYRRIELCKGFIFWVAVSLKLLRELQCVKQEISPLKKKNEREFVLWTTVAGSKIRRTSKLLFTTVSCTCALKVTLMMP